jgi:hypothetical protein
VALIVWIGLEMVYEDGKHLYARFSGAEHETAGAPPATGTAAPSITGGPSGSTR